MMHLRALLVAPLLLAAAPSPRPLDAERPAPLLLVSWTGGDRAGDPAPFEPLLEEARFAGAWKSLVPGAVDAHLPKVSTDHCVGFAISGGSTWNSTGWSVRAIDRVGDEWHVRLDPLTFQSRDAVRTRPYGMFLLTRVAGATLVIDENVTDLMGQPPQWKERGRFDVPALPRPR
jgi:hypothetical protein